MKKFMTLAVLAAMCVAAQAAKITWGWGGVVYVSTDGESAVRAADSSIPEADATRYQLQLVYLGTSVTSYNLDTLRAVNAGTDTTYEIIDRQDGTKWNSSTAGATNGKFFSTGVSASTSKVLENNASFTVAVYDKIACDYVQLYAATKTGSGTTLDDYANATVGDAIDYRIVTVKDMSATKTGSVWAAGSGVTSAIVAIPVPEPATAALALAGLALLIRRRK